MSESQVTRAADQMRMSQPAMSNALGRLRVLFRDPLLVRTPQGMVPTARALEIAESVRRGLRHIDEALTRSGSFDPTSTDLTVRIMTTDYVAELLMPALMAKLESDAPKLKLVLRTMNPSRVREDLELGESHLVIGYFDTLSEGLYASSIMTDPVACLVRSAHPIVQGRLGVDEYVSLRHACFAGGSPPDTFTIEHSIDVALAGLGLDRVIGFKSANIPVIMKVVALTDMVAAVPLGAARRAGERLGLQVVPLPLHVPDVKVSLIWHERTHKDVAHYWFREAVRGVAKQVVDLQASPGNEDRASGFTTFAAARSRKA